MLKKTVEPTGPEIQASQNSVVPIHIARRSRRKVWRRVSWPTRVGSRSMKSAVAAVTSSSAPNRTTNSSATCSSTVRRRRAPISAPARPPEGR